MGGCQPEELLREIEFLKETLQLRAEKQRLELRITKLTADLAAKSEEFWNFHAGQERILNDIWNLVDVLGEVVNKARMFDENFLSKTGEADK